MRRTLVTVGLMIVSVLCSVAHCKAQDVADSDISECDSIGCNIKDGELRSLGRQYILRGKWMCGVAVSYNRYNSEDGSIAMFIDNLDFAGSIYGVYPYIGYFYRNNNCIGLKLGIAEVNAQLNSADINLSDDVNISVDAVSFNYRTYSAVIYHRIYCGLSAQSAVAFFNDTDLMLRYGISRFKDFNSADKVNGTKTLSREVSLNVSPGISVFVVDNVSAYVSLAVAGVGYKEQKQYDNNIEVGYRHTGGVKLKFDILSVKFGVSVLI